MWLAWIQPSHCKDPMQLYIDTVESGFQGRAINIIILHPAQGPLSAMGEIVGKLSFKTPKGS